MQKEQNKGIFANYCEKLGQEDSLWGPNNTWGVNTQWRKREGVQSCEHTSEKGRGLRGGGGLVGKRKDVGREGNQTMRGKGMGGAPS